MELKSQIIFANFFSQQFARELSMPKWLNSNEILMIKICTTWFFMIFFSNFKIFDFLCRYFFDSRGDISFRQHFLCPLPTRPVRANQSAWVFLTDWPTNQNSAFPARLCDATSIQSLGLELNVMLQRAIDSGNRRACSSSGLMDGEDKIIRNSWLRSNFAAKFNTES